MMVFAVTMKQRIKTNAGSYYNHPDFKRIVVQ